MKIIWKHEKSRENHIMWQLAHLMRQVTHSRSTWPQKVPTGRLPNGVPDFQSRENWNAASREEKFGKPCWRCVEMSSWSQGAATTHTGTFLKPAQHKKKTSSSWIHEKFVPRISPWEELVFFLCWGLLRGRAEGQGAQHKKKPVLPRRPPQHKKKTSSSPCHQVL